ncbi:MAG: YkgJ family cysteine cluster protein [Planctomycetes bacterium]|nr:YkgJ family cysteine cluster protein [Planctomycetota bacterium]
MDAPRDPGLDGVVPFRFACHRCGHCCSGHSGFVWLAAGEVEALAASLGATSAAFAARHVRAVRDPRTGEQRLALRETEAAGGRCTLLVGRNTCSAYAARPQHCRTFPYWDSVLQDPAGFEAARATCPGIAVVVDEETRVQAFAALARLYASLAPSDPPTTCCLDEPGSETTFATALEVDYALAAAPTPAGACRLGNRRPGACRTQGSGEECLQAVRAIERAVGYPAAYSALADLISTREGMR